MEGNNIEKKIQKLQEKLKDLKIKDYKINNDLTVDVVGDVNLSGKGLTEIPVKFGVITGSFYCSNNQLTSLKGALKR